MTLLAPLHAPDDDGTGRGRSGHRPALVSDEGTVTYDALVARVEELAERLGATRRLVLIAASNDVDTVVAYLAVRRGSHVAMVVDASNEGAVDALATAYDPDVVLAGADLVERRAGTAHELHPDLALLLSTSGSTGASKLVRLSEVNLDSNAAAIARYLGLTPDDRAITSLPLHYCYGLSVLNSHLAAGASVVLSDLSVVDGCFWDLLRRTEATSFAGVPHTFELLDRVGFDTMSLPSLRYVTQAGGRMAPETVRRYARLGARDGWDLYVMYGQTEATARMAYLPPHLAIDRPAAVGVVVPGGALTIAEPDDRGVGEVVYNGPNVMLGYATTPGDLSLGRSIDHLRTGDLGRIDDDGLLEIVGRRSRIIKPFGVRVDLDDLQHSLASAGIRAHCAGDDDKLVIAVEHATDIAPATTFVDTRLRLPSSRRRVIHVPETPRLATAKVDYDAIRRLAAPTPSGEYADADVRAAFADVLDIDPPADDDTFVSLGGDSLSYVEMSVVLEELLGDVPPDWHRRTIVELEQHRRTVRPPDRRWTRLDTTVVLRAISIVLIVGTHTRLWRLPGGAHALLAVAGFNFARFQIDGHRRWSSIGRVVVPSVCWIGFVAATSDQFAWPHALMLNGVIGQPNARWAYWFVEALITILVAVTALLCVPKLRTAAQRWPFTSACAMVATGLLVRFDVVVDLTTDHRLSRPHEVFWLFALGWAAAVATTRPQRVLVLATAAIGTAGFFHDPLRELFVVGSIAAMTFVPTVPVPRRITGACGALAGASLYIYLTHFQIYPPLLRAAGSFTAAVGAITVGVLAERVATAAQRGGARRVSRACRTIRRERGAGATVDAGA